MPGPVRAAAPVSVRETADRRGSRWPSSDSQTMRRPTRSRSGQHPDAVAAGKAKCQQPTQVDRGHLQRPPQLVTLDPLVGHPPTAVGDQPGDAAFYHRPPGPIALLEGPGHRLAAGGAQLVLVRMQADNAATLGGRAAPAQRAALAWPELVIARPGPPGTRGCQPAGRSGNRGW
jgi:hypothetical protein